MFVRLRTLSEVSKPSDAESIIFINTQITEKRVELMPAARYQAELVYEPNQKVLDTKHFVMGNDVRLLFSPRCSD